MGFLFLGFLYLALTTPDPVELFNAERGDAVARRRWRRRELVETIYYI